MKIIIVLCVILAILIVYTTTHSCSKSLVSKFLYTQSKHTYNRIVAELGHPDVVLNRPNGFVIWFLDNSPFTSVILKDEQVPYGNRYDCIYATVNLNISDNDLQSIVSMNKSAFYDRDMGELTIRCNSLSGCRATIFAILQRLTNPNVWNGILSKNVEQQTLSKIINGTYTSECVDSCIAKKLNTINTKNSIEGFHYTKKYHAMEGFFPKEYRQIPVAP